MRVLGVCSYKGTNYYGWQKQVGFVSVQSTIEEVLSKVYDSPITITGSGRTDAGVHALGMVAHFDLKKAQDANTVMRALNFYLVNKPVSVLDCEIVADDFNARFDCVARHYKYVVLNRSAQPVLNKNRVWWVPRKLNMTAMKHAASRLICKHDFTSFRASECQAKSPIKTLDSATVTKHGDEIIFEFSARSFLHHQVRNMVGTLVEIGIGKPYDIDEIFAAKNRSAAGPNAPASGLFFVSADYSNAARDSNE